jgi:hypothetical protein
MIQHAFELVHDRNACRALIEDYAANGGDQSLTEDFLRQACNMKARTRDANPTPGVLAMLDAGSTPPEKAAGDNGVANPMLEAAPLEIRPIIWSGGHTRHNPDQGDP